MRVVLELNENVVFSIEKMTDTKIKDLLEMEINDHPVTFIEKLGYNNY